MFSIALYHATQQVKELSKEGEIQYEVRYLQKRGC